MLQLGSVQSAIRIAAVQAFANNTDVYASADFSASAVVCPVSAKRTEVPASWTPMCQLQWLLCRLCWIQDRHARIFTFQCIRWQVQHFELHPGWHGGN